MNIRELKNLYNNKQNIMQYLKTSDLPLIDQISIAYDIQSGSYIEYLSNNTEYVQLKQKTGEKLGKILKDLKIQTCCEAGVGEGTTLKFIIESTEQIKFFAFDISVSRVLYCQKFLNENNVTLFVSHMGNIPIRNEKVDSVITFHALEPNGGREEPILKELARIAKRYLILVEPDFESFDEEQRNRMIAHGYCKDIRGALKRIGLKIIIDEPWDLNTDEHNKASLIVAEKAEKSALSTDDETFFISPTSGKSLYRYNGAFFCPSDGTVFPILNQIPIFVKGKEILVSHYNHFFEPI